MELTPAQNNVVSAAAPLADAISADANELKVEADFDTFLSLLTAQLRNQDPLEPVDSTAFVAQLAQFSAVEQQVQTNEALSDILGLLGGGDTAGLASWLGADVKAPGPVFFNGKPLTLTTTPSPTATQSNLVVRDEAGDVIARQPVGSEDEQIVWNGLTTAGAAASRGLYSFSVESVNGTTILPVQQAAGFSKVEEVRLGGEVPALVLQGGDTISLPEVLAVR